MQYLLLIYDDETIWETLPADQNARIMEAYGKFGAELRDSGAFVGANRLHATTLATSVRVREGEQLVTDGPFAETKEQLGGYFLIDVDTLDEAIAWAAKIPSAALGTVEVRPIMPTRVPTEA